MLFREFPEYEIAGVSEAEVTSPMKTLSDVSTFANLSTSFVLFLLGRSYFAEANFNIRGELEGWPMERTSLLF